MLLRSRPSPLRRAWLLAALPALILPAACNREPEEPPLEVEWEGKPLEPSAPEIFEYPGDGKWHPSPFLAYAGHKIAIRPSGESQVLEKQLMQFRLGGNTPILSDREVFVVTKPGRIDFRFAKERAGGYSGPVKVELTREP